MCRLLHALPSLGLSVLMILIGGALAFGLHKLNLYGLAHGWRTLEQYGWGLISKLGWWYWGLYPVLGAVGLLYAATLDRPQTKWGFVTRLAILTGFNFYLFSPGNSVFRSFGGLFVLIGIVMWLRQQSLACRAKRPKLDLTGAPFLVRLYVGLTTAGIY